MAREKNTIQLPSNLTSLAAGNPSLFTFPNFSGTLGDLAAELRSERLEPGQVPLLLLTREVLARATAQPLTEGEHAETLPLLAGVIALKALCCCQNQKR